MVDKVDGGALRAVCAPCGTALIERHANDVEFQIAPQQTRQLAALGILGDADWRLTQLNQAVRRHRRKRA